MAEILKVDVTGEELARRIRVQLEFSIRDAEEMLNQGLVKAIAERAAGEWFKDNRKKLVAKLDIIEIGQQVVKVIVDKAIFDVAVERAKTR